MFKDFIKTGFDIANGFLASTFKSGTVLCGARLSKAVVASCSTKIFVAASNSLVNPASLFCSF